MKKNKYLFCLFCFLFQCAPSPKGKISVSSQTPVSSKSSARFLALGDSYTIGESVSPSERWPMQLVALLEKEGLSVLEPEIIAVTGWTTDELMTGIQKKKPQGPYEIVSLLIGVNNQYRGRSLEEYRQQFCQLLQSAIVFANHRPKQVLVLSIPDWGQTPFAEGRDRLQIHQQIDQFNQVNREETQKVGSFYLDITPMTRLGLQESSLVAPDGLHPSGAMYRLWAEQALLMAKEILTASSQKK